MFHTSKLCCVIAVLWKLRPFLERPCPLRFLWGETQRTTSNFRGKDSLRGAKS